MWVARGTGAERSACAGRRSCSAGCGCTRGDGADAGTEDCALADVVIGAVPTRRACAGARRVIDRFDLWRHGAHALWFGPTPGQVRIESVEGERGRRPWSGRPR